MKRNLIALKYLTSYFPLDLISSFPFEQVISSAFPGSNTIRIKVLNFLRILRLSRLFKVFKVFQSSFIVKYLIKSEEGRLLITFFRNNIGIFDLLRLMLTLFLFAH